jgi:pimeloyl-ACP methyl ester carboxylesterase
MSERGSSIIGPTHGSAPRLASVWTTLTGLRCHGLVSVWPAPVGAPPVVLVHGFAVSSRYMVPTAEALAGRYPIFAPDLPGYGLSDAPERVLDVPRLADVLAAWLVQRKIERAIFVANSFGCQIVAEVVLRRPELLTGAILIGPTTDASARTLYQQLWRLARDLPHEPASLWLIQARDYLRFGLRWQLQTAQAMLDDRIEEKLPRIQQPLLVVRGEHDPIAPQAWVERLAHLAPAGEWAVVPGAAHAVNYTAPAAVTALIDRLVGQIAEAGHGG